jgi:hypothetical protein
MRRGFGHQGNGGRSPLATLLRRALNRSIHKPHFGAAWPSTPTGSVNLFGI